MPTYEDPVRLRVLKALTDALEEISVANGYRHDLAGAVLRGRLMFGSGDPLPMLSILEVPLPEEQIAASAGNPTLYGKWGLIVQGWADDDHKNPTDPAHFLMADVKQRLAVAKKLERGDSLLGMGDTVTNLEIGVGVVRPPDELSDKAYFWLGLMLTIVERADKPYGA